VRNYQSEKSSPGVNLIFMRGGKVSPDRLKTLRQMVVSGPEDVDNRLHLLASLARSDSSEFRTQLLWMIDNQPRHCVHEEVILHSDNLTYRQARARWLRQVRLNANDVTVLHHAARFFSLLAPEDAVKFLEKASGLDLSNDRLPLELSHLYRLLAVRFSASKNRRLAAKSVQQMKIAVKRYQSSNSGDSYLLSYFSTEIKELADFALTYRLLDEARDLGQLLLDHKQINACRYDSESTLDSSTGVYELSESFGHAVLGRVALAKGRADIAEEHLGLMMKLRVGKLSDWAFVNDLLEAGEVQLASSYIEYFEERLRKSLEGSADGCTASTDDNRSFALNMQKTLQKWLIEIQGG
jgi:hypothetical protein